MSNILIVGASGGIGLAVADKLSSTHRLWSAGRSGPTIARDVKHITWDAMSDSFPASQLPETLHGLVYAPGSIRLQPFNRLKDDDFLQDLQLNLMGAVRVIRAALPALKRSNAGSVVLFSTVAVTLGMPMHASIAAAKGAVEGLTRSLAAEFAPAIRFNAIAPSLTDTPLAARLLKTERHKEAAAARHPLGRVGTPVDMANAVNYLLSEESSWVTGQILHVDGGLSRLRTS